MESEHDGFERTLIAEMGLDARNLERRKALVGLGPDDVPRLRLVRDVMRRSAEELAGVFLDVLLRGDEARGISSDRDLRERARRMKVEHLLAMVEGDYGPAYAEQRVRLGLLYSRAGIDNAAVTGAFNTVLRALGTRIMAEGGAGFDAYLSLTKVASLDIALTADVLTLSRERVIRQQQDAIREMTTPVLQVRDRLLLLPIIGVIDTYRARLITENLLRSIRSARARVVIMDITGVATIDSRVANHLLQTIAAARLMGARVIVTGLSSDVAQSLVGLGIELNRLNTVGDLQGGFEEAERLLDLRLVAGAARRGPVDDSDAELGS